MTLSKIPLKEGLRGNAPFPSGYSMNSYRFARFRSEQKSCKSEMQFLGVAILLVFLAQTGATDGESSNCPGILGVAKVVKQVGELR